MAVDRRTTKRTLTPHQQALAQTGENAARRRSRWEGGAYGSERMQDAPAMLGTKMTTGQIYAARNWGEETQAETGHPRAYDRQIPGLEDRHAAPTPDRWEDIEPRKQADIARRVKAKSGATLESMQRSFGSQLDQAYVRAERSGDVDDRGRVRPPGQDFYTSGEPRQVIRETAREHKVPQQLVAAMHADNSPNTAFRRTGQSGEPVYPQDVMTRSALSQIQDGVSWTKVRRPPGAEGYTTNFEKSARRAQRVLYERADVPDAGSRHGFGPKTAAYMNSWLPSQPDFFTADVHSGGAMVPHQSTEKPAKVDADGNTIMQTVTRSAARGGTMEVPKREKSEREKTIETKGFHSMADYAARQAIQERGLGSLRQAQAAQWNEERVQRFGEHRSYHDQDQRAHREVPGQGALF